MNILFMADVPQNPNAGAAGTEYQTIQALRKLGHEVETVWSDDMHRRIKHGNLHYLLELPRTYERFMVDRLRQKSFDVIHVNQPHGYRAARTLRNLKSNAVFIHRSHGLELRYERDVLPWERVYGSDVRSPARKLVSRVLSRMLAYNSRQIARYADGHIVSANQCREFLSKTLQVPASRIAVIPQAPPTAFLDQSVKPMTKDRLSRVLYVGQYEFCKAPMIVAEVMNHLAQANSETEFTWVCAATDHAHILPLLSPELRMRIKLLEPMAQDKLIDVFDAHGVFLFPSFFEGFGKVFLEAMSRGLCVVAAANSAAPDVIKDGVSGVLVPTGNVDSMVEACVRLQRMHDVAARVSAEAIRCAHTHTWERVATETLAFYSNRVAAKKQEIERGSTVANAKRVEIPTTSPSSSI